MAKGGPILVASDSEEDLPEGDGERHIDCRQRPTFRGQDVAPHGETSGARKMHQADPLPYKQPMELPAPDRSVRSRMKNDSDIRQDVIKELGWDPKIPNADAIGVAVEDGAVTLTGHVFTYPEKLAAAKAAERVYGVKAVANQLEVRLTDRHDDSDIAKAIAHILDWNTNIPTGKVRARVEHGWVTLEGIVEYPHQRDEVERMVRHVRGVIGVTNDVEVRPAVSAVQVEEQIEEALRRQADLDARSIRVEVSDHTARVYGHVHSVHEAQAIRKAAAAAPGVARVESYISITP